MVLLLGILSLMCPSATEQCLTLPEALETYVTQKGAGKPKTLKAFAQRACSYLVDTCGVKDLA
jgi:integrase